jgi:hypothetical protein
MLENEALSTCRRKQNLANFLKPTTLQAAKGMCGVPESMPHRTFQAIDSQFQKSVARHVPKPSDFGTSQKTPGGFSGGR